MNAGDTCLLNFCDTFEFCNFAVVNQLAVICTIRIQTTDDLDHCGFAGAVFSDESMDMSALDIEGYIIKCTDARKGLADSFQLKDIIFQIKQLLSHCVILLPIQDCLRDTNSG